MKRLAALLLALAVTLAGASGFAPNASSEEGYAPALGAQAAVRIRTGDEVILGHYEQDGDANNGAEPVEWIVLESDGDRVTLISKYGLATRPYHDEQTDVTWRTCSLRAWLNGDFLNAVFTPKEQAQLESVAQATDSDSPQDTAAGGDVQDRVYILSLDEAKRLLPTKAERTCIPTGSSLSNGARTAGEAGGCWWWLRSPGYYSVFASDVRCDGEFCQGGHFVNDTDEVVRPVICARLSSQAQVTQSEESYEVGGTVTFGHYDQDGNPSNGPEDIEWTVIDVSDAAATLISRYGLDARPYAAAPVDETWETCAIRSWLNGDFLAEAFTEAEQARLETVALKAEANAIYGTSAGNDTQDRVYLLSMDEAKQYFATEEARRCRPTRTATANGVEGADASWWWLRTPGYIASYAAFINADGFIGDLGLSVDSASGMVRPVIRVILEQK